MKLMVTELGRVEYVEALAIQEELRRLRQDARISDLLLLVEHPPVITLGRRGHYHNILLPAEELQKKGIPIYEVNRGGDVTYHGPGQIVGYPIMNLALHGKDIKDFIRKLEEVFIRLLKEDYHITARRDEKTYTGVWVGNEKITAIGVAVQHWVTMHGFAFNVNTRMEPFRWINPCGITDKGVTSLEKLLGFTPDFEALNSRVSEYFCQVFDFDPEMVPKNKLFEMIGRLT